MPCAVGSERNFESHLQLAELCATGDDVRKMSSHEAFYAARPRYGWHENAAGYAYDGLAHDGYANDGYANDGHANDEHAANDARWPNGRRCKPGVGASAPATSTERLDATSQADGKDHKEEPGSHSKQRKEMDDEEDYSRRTFNCSPILKDQILGSSYFKSMLQLTTIDEIIEEIKNYADTLDVYNSGSSTSPSNFVCQVYRIFTLPEAEDLNQLQVILENSTPTVRILEFSCMATEHHSGKVKHQLERELAPISQYRKRMEAHTKNNIKKIAGTPVEVFHDGQWVPGTAQDFVGLDAHLGAAHGVLACVVGACVDGIGRHWHGTWAQDRGDDKESGDEKSGSEDEAKKKRKRRGVFVSQAQSMRLSSLFGPWK
eukprot:Skav224713  [mRNA]  locus=scaffold699:323963:343736:+ [translate_table: standard]